jgi:hypothetical protein
VSCTKLVVPITLLALMVCPSNLRAAVTPPTIDGNLSDWGISLDGQKHLVYNTAYGYAYNPNQNVEKRGQITLSGRTIVYDLEDSDDTRNNYPVGPLGGGQNYDAEALVVSVVGSNLYIGISTGQRPDNGAKCFAPGDVCITQGTDVWGVEVGGGSTTHNASEVVDGNKGTTYGLNPQGYTNWSTQLSSQKAGSIWEGGTWNVGISGSGNVPTQLNTGGSKGGTYLGTSDYVYNFDSAFGQHAFIELCIPNYAELLGNDLGGASIRWAPVCGNDQLSLCVVLPPDQLPGPVPEPASVMIWAVLLLAAACFGRKKLSRVGRP